MISGGYGIYGFGRIPYGYGSFYGAMAGAGYNPAAYVYGWFNYGRGYRFIYRPFGFFGYGGYFGGGAARLMYMHACMISGCFASLGVGGGGGAAASGTQGANQTQGTQGAQQAQPSGDENTIKSDDSDDSDGADEVGDKPKAAPDKPKVSPDKVNQAKAELEKFLTRDGKPVARVSIEGGALTITLLGDSPSETGRNADFIRDKILKNKDKFNAMFKGGVRLKIYADSVDEKDVASSAAEMLKPYAIKQISDITIPKKGIKADELRDDVVKKLKDRKIDVRGFKGAVITIRCYEGAIAPAVRKAAEDELKRLLGVNGSVKIKLDEVSPKKVEETLTANLRARTGHDNQGFKKVMKLRRILKLVHQDPKTGRLSKATSAKVDKAVDALLTPDKDKGIPVSLDRAIDIVRKKLEKRALRIAKDVKSDKLTMSARQYRRWYNRVKGDVGTDVALRIDPKKVIAKKSRVKTRRWRPTRRPRRRRRVIRNK